MTYNDLKNRIKKRFTHLQKWAKKETITCFRVYERDLPDYPLIIDWYDGDVVAWMYDRKKDETDSQKKQFEENTKETILNTFNLTDSNLYIKKRGRQRGVTTQYKKLSHQSKTKQIKENNLSFQVNLSDYLDTGLFLDHRNTRHFCRQLVKGKRFLNLFSYTGSFTCYAAAGGAISTTSVDLNKTYSEWAELNLRLNGFETEKKHRCIVGNVMAFMKNEASKRRYDVIVCDPPTFSNSKVMKRAFSVEEDYPELIKDCLKLLAPEGTVLFSTNSRTFQLDPKRLPKHTSIKNITEETLPMDFKGKKSHQCWVVRK